MTCADLQRNLPEIVEGRSSSEQDAHLKSCRDCSEVLSELSFIVSQAQTLQASDDPSPRVWNSIEIALREEGLLRQPQPELVLAASAEPRRRWSLSWAIPVAAMLALVFGTVVYRRAFNGSTMATVEAPTGTAAAKAAPVAPAAQAPAMVATVAAKQVAAPLPAEDQELLQVVSTTSPGMTAAYEANLQDVNAYIRDAEEAARLNPQDEEAQQVLMDAYEQRNMLHEMVLTRSLP